jgi:hypothetical protein
MELDHRLGQLGVRQGVRVDVEEFIYSRYQPSGRFG